MQNVHNFTIVVNEAGQKYKKKRKRCIVYEEAFFLLHTTFSSYLVFFTLSLFYGLFNIAFYSSFRFVSTGCSVSRLGTNFFSFF